MSSFWWCKPEKCEILCRSANEFLAKDGDAIFEDIELYGKIENALILLRHGRKPP